MDTQEKYNLWLTNDVIDKETQKELKSIASQPAEIEDRFYKHIEFGTGGIRGILGAGTNRINRYTLRRVTKGLAHYIHSFGPSACKRGVVIAYDSRHQSKELASETGLTLQSLGIKAYIFTEPTPTPLLSYSVRQLKTIAGIVITASHNPPEYNGYKVYWEDGGQITPQRATAISRLIQQELDIPLLSQTHDIHNSCTWLDSTLSQEYIARLKTLLRNPPGQSHSNLTIVYTPLHGTGGKIVKQLLQETGFTNTHLVPEQEHPDPRFSTVSLPNPEDRKAFDHAISLGNNVRADLLLASDPDCDRLGVLVKHNNRYLHLTGNQVGAILLNHLLQKKHTEGTLPHNGVIIKTIVTSNLGKAIAKKYGLETIETLTGFKYIGEKIEEFAHSKEKTFLFGYEESCGYLAETFVRDKDGVMSILLLCEVASDLFNHGKTLYDALEELYHEHGYYLESSESRTFKGKDGMAQMNQILEAWRNDRPTRLYHFHIETICDHLQQTCFDIKTSSITKSLLPQENALHFTCHDGTWFCLRPSGTEPKLKLYVGVQGISRIDATHKLEFITNEVLRSIDAIYK